jgi:hypothetical protein
VPDVFYSKNGSLYFEKVWGIPYFQNYLPLSFELLWNLNCKRST